ncbi:MAG: hypothetical protein Q8Q94_04060 [bacterium]|nr:hypothetical protein [bacterium]MDZ4299811.1 hypothetical protein [Candidatus Sungbacteria bacterium]
MSTITIKIPKKILERSATRRLIIDPKEFEKELWRRWEMGDAREAAQGVDNVLTAKEEAVVRKGEQQLRQGKSKAWQKIKHELAF